MKKKYTQVGARIRANEGLRPHYSLRHLIGKVATIIVVDDRGRGVMYVTLKWDDTTIDGSVYWSDIHHYFDLTDEPINDRLLDQQRREEFAARYL